MQYGLSEGGIEIFKRVLNRNFNLKSIIAADSLFGKTSFIHEINKERENKLYFLSVGHFLYIWKMIFEKYFRPFFFFFWPQ
jgi:hypothetical protein